MSVITDAKKHIEELVNDLRGENDFMPFMLLRREEEVMFLGIAGMETEVKDDIAAIMFGMITGHRAQEAVFASASWMATYEKGSPDFLPPSQHPDRKEVVVLVHATGDGTGSYTAQLHRRDNRVLLGEWQALPVAGLGTGRFSDAMIAGIRLAGHPLLQREIDKELGGDTDAAVRTAARAYRRFQNEGSWSR